MMTESHGRVKVRTTAEQAEAKRKEREKKLKIYNETTNRIHEKRKNGDMDKESLSLSEQVLSANPDYLTLWNFRREIFLHMKEENSADALQEICQRELSFLTNCLQVNPKSYCVWHHRQWIMEFMPQPSWKEELRLCNLFLSYDARNFHCWDYRRYTVNKANISPVDEFNFSTEKIRENFSNYSSWHYRSKLLPLIHPCQSGDMERVEEEALMKEFDLAQNAFFTDPYDQSAWFYHRWLLGRARPLMDMSCLYVRYTRKNPLSLLMKKKLLESGVTVFRTIILQQFGYPLFSESEASTTANESHLFRAELTAVHSSVLQQELDSCRLLLQEEPDNKWTMLTMVLLMRALDPLVYEQETDFYLEKLVEVDGFRKGYYKDLRRKFKLENVIERHRKTKEDGDRTIDLSNMDLTFLSHMDRLVLMNEVNMSNNQLSSLDGCNFLQCVKFLNVSKNSLCRITKKNSPLRLGYLEELSLADNNISNLESLKSLRYCTLLRKLDMRGNPCCGASSYRQEVKSILASLQELDGAQI
ncbi:geranylgeranyl transferase type-2 subunit alpha-like isoform X3 [Acropora millepora]|uniref:geranylgeranyl transferase type-2 subunit alpha-like isoform X3 n=1 Tax=Acropora millepora TaxID=45264 RepID=UPI001CF3DE3F|nr:geranylgeranyl transferase type-2 subunit alpha-like isoform X3 [Acropora millepora]